MPGEPDPPGAAGEQHELLARLRAVAGAKDAEPAMLRVELAVRARAAPTAGAEDRRAGAPAGPGQLRLGIRVRRSRSGRKSGAGPSAGRRNASERERRNDRKPGGQPGHPGRGVPRDPDPDQQEGAGPPTQCSRYGTSPAGAQHAGSSWAQVIDVSNAPDNLIIGPRAADPVRVLTAPDMRSRSVCLRRCYPLARRWHGETLRALAADGGWRYACCEAPQAAEIRLGTVWPRGATRSRSVADPK